MANSIVLEIVLEIFFSHRILLALLNTCNLVPLNTLLSPLKQHYKSVIQRFWWQPRGLQFWFPICPWDSPMTSNVNCKMLYSLEFQGQNIIAEPSGFNLLQFAFSWRFSCFKDWQKTICFKFSWNFRLLLGCWDQRPSRVQCSPGPINPNLKHWRREGLKEGTHTRQGS